MRDMANRERKIAGLWNPMKETNTSDTRQTRVSARDSLSTRSVLLQARFKVLLGLKKPKLQISFGVPTRPPVYMMEHVKPQQSFSRVRPVLPKGEGAGWALDGARLVGTPEAQRHETVRKRWNSLLLTANDKRRKKAGQKASVSGCVKLHPPKMNTLNQQSI